MRLDATTSTLGHQTGHALNAEQSEKSLNFTSYAITEEMRVAGPGGEFDAMLPVFGRAVIAPNTNKTLRNDG